MANERSRVEEIRKEICEKDIIIDSLHAESARLSEQIKKLSAPTKSLPEAAKKQKEELASLKSQLQELKAQTSQLTRDVTDKDTIIASLKQSVFEHVKQTEHLLAQNTELQKQIT